jgi:hypothetical protein
MLRIPRSLTKHDIAEDLNSRQHRIENLKSRTVIPLHTVNICHEGFCEHGSDPLGSTQGMEFLDHVRVPFQEGLCTMDLVQHLSYKK